MPTKASFAAKAPEMACAAWYRIGAPGTIRRARRVPHIHSRHPLDRVPDGQMKAHPLQSRAAGLARCAAREAPGRDRCNPDRGWRHDWHDRAPHSGFPHGSSAARSSTACHRAGRHERPSAVCAAPPWRGDLASRLLRASNSRAWRLSVTRLWPSRFAAADRRQPPAGAVSLLQRAAASLLQQASRALLDWIAGATAFG